MRPLELKSRITANRLLKGGVWQLDLECKEIAAGVSPGQFVHLAIPGFHLRRPFTVAGTEGDIISVIYRVAGRGTEAMTGLISGTHANVLGPLGRGFSPPASARPLLLGGGMGAAALLLLAARLRRCTLAVGARSKHELWIERINLPASIEILTATDDGSCGYRGNLVQLATELFTSATWVAACGPKPMLRSLQQLLEARGVPGQFALEERMACGMGACAGCVCQRKRGGPALVCKDGPVFSAGEVVL